jgi:hypothetical protein
MGLAELKELQSALSRQERTEGNSGAVPNTPKATLLDASDVQASHNEKRVRWVNINNPAKVQDRLQQGYTRIPLAEGGREVGDLALFEIPREGYDARVADLARQNRQRLEAHKMDMERAAEGIARELRDKHGLKVDILVKD